MSVGSGVGYSYAFVSPHFKTDQKITVQSKMCTDTSQPSEGQIVQPDPGTIPEPTVDPFYQGADTVVSFGPGRRQPARWCDAYSVRQLCDAAEPADRRSGDAGRRADSGHRSRGAGRQPAGLGNSGAVHPQQRRSQADRAALQQLAGGENSSGAARRHQGVGDLLRTGLRDQRSSRSTAAPPSRSAPAAGRRSR